MALTALSLICATVIVWCSLHAIDAMTRRTRNCIRFAYVLLIVGGFGFLSLALYREVDQWITDLVQLFLIAGIALHLVVDRRRHRTLVEATPCSNASASQRS